MIAHTKAYIRPPKRPHRFPQQAYLRGARPGSILFRRGVQGGDAEVIEADLKRLLAWRCRDHTDLNRHRRREVSKPKHRPFLTIEGIGNLHRVVIALQSHPDRGRAVRARQYGPVGELARDDGTDILMSIHELDSGLDPVSLVQANHQTGLMVELAILPAYPDNGFEVSRARLVSERSIVTDKTVVRHTPVVRSRRDSFR